MVVFVFETVSLNSLSSPQTHYPLTFAYQVLGLQPCASTPHRRIEFKNGASSAKHLWVIVFFTCLTLIIPKGQTFHKRFKSLLMSILKISIGCQRNNFKYLYVFWYDCALWNILEFVLRDHCYVAIPRGTDELFPVTDYSSEIISWAFPILLGHKPARIACPGVTWLRVGTVLNSLCGNREGGQQPVLMVLALCMGVSTENNLAPMWNEIPQRDLRLREGPKTA